jgi:phosphate transport system substrate-binding protein
VLEKKSTAWLSLLLVFGLTAAACSSDDGSAADDGGSGGASGAVNISGSSTVEPISIRVAELFEDVNPGVAVDVDGPGTGDGFALFCEGTTDMSNASRTIKDEEAETCADNSIGYIELYVAIDGLAVLTNPANDSVECLSTADMYALMSAESESFSSWSDAQDLAAELGSDTEFPDARLDISAPGAESGTYDSFLELVLDKIAETRDEEESVRNYPGQADDNIIIQGIQGSNSSFGWVGYAFAAEASDVKVLEVADEPNGECVAANEDTIANGEYPLSRGLYVYVNAEKAASNAALAEFVDFYLSDDGIEAVSGVGYVQIPQEDLDATRDTWESRTTGKQA